MRYNEQVLSGQPVLASDSIRLMEARLNPLHLPIASSCCYSFPERPLLLPRRSITNSTPFPTSLPPYLIRASSSSSSSSSSTSERVYRGPMPRRDLVADWVSNNDAAVRSFPIYAGVVSLAAVLINRTFSGIAPVADASSSQSRADILALALAVTNLLTGLVWLSIRPKYISPAVPCGVKCRWLYPGLPNFASLELLWAWDSLSDVTCCRSLVIVYGNICLLQIGIAAESSKNSGDATSVDVVKLIQGSLYQNVMKSAKQSYLANLSLYPGKSELPFFPANTQSSCSQLEIKELQS